MCNIWELNLECKSEGILFEIAYLYRYPTIVLDLVHGPASVRVNYNNILETGRFQPSCSQYLRLDLYSRKCRKCVIPVVCVKLGKLYVVKHSCVT